MSYALRKFSLDFYYLDDEEEESQTFIEKVASFAESIRYPESFGSIRLSIEYPKPETRTPDEIRADEAKDEKELDEMIAADAAEEII
jgi:hypothetical protein